MGDRMTPIPFGRLMDWILTEYQEHGSIFGIRRFYKADWASRAKQPSREPETPFKLVEKQLELFGQSLETPFGPAAGPHTQLAQNIIAAYVTGSRFFELKTVQVLDGEDLPVAKPCILAEEEGYNCEWSTELRVSQARDEYIKAWIALKVLAWEHGFGSPDGFIFNMSVGYDLAGIQSEKIDGFLDEMKEAGGTAVWRESMQWLGDNLWRFKCLTRGRLEAISSRVCTSVTVSTLHGCPPQEMERIASYLMEKKGLHTFIKCNPTLLGYETARGLLDSMGYDQMAFGAFHFQDDLQFADAVPMLERLLELAGKKKLTFGVKITNTFPVDVTANELPSQEMYMSGKALCALSLSVAYRLSQAFDGKLRISYSGGADYFNIDRIFGLGIWPITAATTFLKPGGYQRGIQMAEKLAAMEYGAIPGTDVAAVEYGAIPGVDVAGLARLIEEIKVDPHHRKAAKPARNRKLAKKVPLLECFTAPCSHGCPIHQDIPAYVKLAGEGKHAQALRVILEKNPLPFITGTICNHRCTDKCIRNFYEEPVDIRGVKLAAARSGYAAVRKDWDAEQKARETGLAGNERHSIATIAGSMQKSAVLPLRKAAVVGAGPAGIAAAHFLARAGVDVTVFERSGVPGGIVAQAIPEFRIPSEAIEKDVALTKALGVQFQWNHHVTDLEGLQASGYDAVFAAVGASQAIPLGIMTERAYSAVVFLQICKKQPEALRLGKHVAIIGAGNTAMDAARAALRIPGVEQAVVVYRRTRRYMPADEEELELALAEGVVFRELLAPRYQKSGKLVCNRVILGEMDASGRQKPVVTQEKVTIQADTVIAALGEKVDAAYYKAQGLALDEAGIPLLSESMESSKPGIYLIGDGAKGPATVVMAIRDAQAAVEHFLSSGKVRWVTQEEEGSWRKIAVDTDVKCAAAKKGILLRRVKTVYNTSTYRKKTDTNSIRERFTEAATPDDPCQSISDREARRCLECDHVCENCVDVCPNRANVSCRIPGSQIPAIVHMDPMCNECGNCQSFCPYDSAPYKEKFTLFANEADFADSTNDGFVILDHENLTTKIRLGSSVTEEALAASECGLYPGLKDIVLSIKENYSYLLSQ